MKAEEKDKFRILVYGIERKGYPKLETLNVGNGVELIFEDFNTKEEFQNYNGVIMFQGIWAKWKTTNDYLDPREYVGDKQNDELRKRVKQLQQLLTVKNGFVCFLMGRMVHDDFDLAKEVINWFSSTYYDAIADNEFVTAKRDELKNYCDKYGVGKTKFTHYGDTDFEVLMGTGSYDGNVGVCFDNRIFYLPCHAPDKDEDHTKELFTILGKGITSLFKKMLQELPEWIEKYSFQKELTLRKEKDELIQKLTGINADISKYDKYKSILASHSDNLRNNVSFILSDGFGYEIDPIDELREDLKIVSKTDKSGKSKVLALVEVKGVNGNVDREAVNQVDSHRERGGFESDFPGILIANTFIKSANSLETKAKDIDKEQIIHAFKNHVLILRTIDLLNALDQIMEDSESKKKFNSLLFSESGWLEVKGKEFVVHHGSNT